MRNKLGDKEEHELIKLRGLRLEECLKLLSMQKGKYLGYKISQFSKEITSNENDRSRISGYKSGKHTIGYDVLKRIEELYGINPQYITAGVLPRFTNTKFIVEDSGDDYESGKIFIKSDIINLMKERILDLEKLNGHLEGRINDKDKVISLLEKSSETRPN